MAAADYKALVQSIYISYFGRPADTIGLQNFTAQLDALKAPTDATGLTAAYANTPALKTLIDSFGTSPESVALYGTDTVGFVTAIYNNVLNRAPDFDGLLFWVNAINNGGLSKGNAALSIMAGALNNTTDQGKIDAQVLQTKVAIASNFTAAIDTGVELAAYQGDAAAATAREMLRSVTATTAAATFQASVDATLATLVENANPGVKLSLTSDVDTLVGGDANDSFTATIDTNVGGTSTLTPLDTIKGGAGNDTLNINVLEGAAGTATLPTVSVSGVEVVNIRADGSVVADVTSWTGVTTAKVTQSVDASLTGAATTALSVSGATGNVQLDGGASQTVVATGGDITLGANTQTAGAISVTQTAQGAKAIAVDGGSTVTVNTTGSTAAGSITIGANNAATGAVAVNSAAANAAGAATLAAIDVTGGSTINVTQTATSALAAAAGSTVTQGAVTIVAGDNTTAVTSKQTVSKAAAAAVTGVAGVTETVTVKFGAAKAGDVITVGGLDFHAKVDMTAAQVAAAFSNLTDPDTQSNGPAKLGTYTGSSTGWTSTVTGDTVVFTSTEAETNVTDLNYALVGTGVAPVLVTGTDGVDAVAAKAGVLGVITGTVAIDDNATGTITSVTVDGYGAGSTIGATTTLSHLANLSLANSGGATAGATDADMAVDAAGVTSLNLSVNAVKGAVSLDASGAASIKTLNVAAAGANSTFALTAAAVETLAVSGDKVVSLTGDLAALKTVTVSGAAGLTLAATDADTITSINTSATTGTVTASIDGTLATYVGGAGNDIVSVTSTTIGKSISLGAGNDTLKLVGAVTGSTVAIAGGDGTDTLSMTAAIADGLDGSTAFASQVTGFEHLTINAAAATTTLDLANLGGYNYVTTTGTVVPGTDVLTLNKMASGGTVVLTAAGLVTVGVTDAATGTADVLNAIVTTATSDLNAGTLTAADVETINLTSNDTDAAAANSNTLTLNAADATKVTATGAAALMLNMGTSTKVVSIDASAMTGDFGVQSANTTDATTIKGGAGADVLIAATGTTADVLIGGAGDDVLVANAGLDTLTGGAGSDTFSITVPSLNSSSYATISDFGKDDLIEFAGATDFAAAKIVQADTAVFQDYVNAAMNASAVGVVSWFQYAGNTYIVMDAGSESTSFVNGEDFIVKLTGAVDLTNATLNTDSGTIGIF